MLWGQQSHCGVVCPHQEGHPLSRRRSELRLRAGKGSSANFGVHTARGRVSVQAGCRPQPSRAPDALGPGLLPPAHAQGWTPCRLWERVPSFPVPGPRLSPSPTLSHAAFSVRCASSRTSDRMGHPSSGAAGRMGHPSSGAAGRWAGKGNFRSKVAPPLEVRPGRLEAEGRRGPGRPAPATGDPRGLSLEKVSRMTWLEVLRTASVLTSFMCQPGLATVPRFWSNTS